jgi:uncharacterized membrane protein YcaP (DUF421 family)
MHWGSLFAINVSPLELVLRGTLTYWFLLLVFRFVLRRDPGSFGVADILMVVIIADASQNAMSGSYDTLAEGGILVATLVAWNYALDWAGYRWKPIQKLTEPPPLQLIRNGRVLGRNLRKELLTLDDLKGQLREAGVEDIGSVRAAYLEGDGKMSVLRYESDPSTPPNPHEGLPGA